MKIHFLGLWNLLHEIDRQAWCNEYISLDLLTVHIKDIPREEISNASRPSPAPGTKQEGGLSNKVNGFSNY